MPVFTLEESSYAGPIPEDEILPAKVTGVKVVLKPFKEDDGSDIHRVEFAFQISDPESKWDGQRMWGDTPTNFKDNPECKLRNWAQELLSAELPIGFQLDTDVLVGQSCRVVVAQKTYEKNGKDQTRNFVKDVIRPKNGSAYASVEQEPF